MILVKIVIKVKSIEILHGMRTRTYNIQLKDNTQMSTGLCYKYYTLQNDGFKILKAK